MYLKLLSKKGIAESGKCRTMASLGSTALLPPSPPPPPPACPPVCRLRSTRLPAFSVCPLASFAARLLASFAVPRQWPACSPTPGRLTTTFRFSAGLLPRRGSGRHVLPMPGDRPRPPAPGPVHSRTVFPPPVRLSCRPALGGAGSAAILAAATRNRQVRSQPTRMTHVPKKVGGHRCGGGLRSAVPGRAGTWYQGRSHTEEERPRSADSRGSMRTGGTPRRRSTRGPAQGLSSLP